VPIFEYICESCFRRSSFFFRGKEEPDQLKCSFCGHDRLTRIMSRFASIKSEEDRLESLADPSKWGGLDESDPKSIARFVKKLGSEMGEDINREELDQIADEAAREAESGSDSTDADTPADEI
jgi:putative FmdB family regulatory protein